MTDYEMHVLAARAADWTLLPEDTAAAYVVRFKGCWNPRNDDSDAFRLMVKLNLNVFHVMATAYAMESETELTGEHNVRHRNDPAAATREAIFKAAVAIGKALS